MPATVTPLRTTGRRPHVVIAGGGIAGAETLLALRAVAGDAVSIELLAPEPDLVLRPLSVAAPFGTADVRRLSLRDLCTAHRARFREDAVSYVDTAGHRVETEGFATVDYDVLVVATGARRRPVADGTVAFHGYAGVVAMQELLADLRADRLHRVVFAVPAGVSWPLPLYELALMTADTIAREELAASVALVTPEADPIAMFGTAASEKVRALLAGHGVAVATSSIPLRPAVGTFLTSAGVVLAERVVTVPVLDGPRVPGLPRDGGGFLPVDEHGAVRDTPDVYAAGDGTDHPVKQGGLAAQQADVVADAIGARLGLVADPAPFRPVLRAQLLTGTLPWYFRAASESGPASGSASAEEPPAPVAAQSPLWWPPVKVAARHLGPYLASVPTPTARTDEPLHDRAPAAGPVDPAERGAARDLALDLADDDAASGDLRGALRWLDAAEHTCGLLPPEYVAKRRRWAGEVELARR